MRRRHFLQTGILAALARPLMAALQQDRLNAAADVLRTAVDGGQVRAAVLHVVQREQAVTRYFGAAASGDAMFLLGSITKPICITALMTLYDRGSFALDDPVRRFIPEFTGDGRESVQMRHLLTHTSGLLDQLPNNGELRKSHAPLATFVDHAIRLPPQFSPGTKYQYSSMGILLATEVARRISGTGIIELTEQAVLRPLGMNHSALGLGRFKLEDMMLCQTEFGAPESGAGDPAAKEWDWNSPYWRKLGAPWGGAHASAPDIAKFLMEFLSLRGAVVKPQTARLMIANQNPPGFAPRGLGLAVGASIGSRGCSERTFGHTGSTGTLAWADPATETICVVLTSLPGRAVQPHPRELVGVQVAAAAT